MSHRPVPILIPVLLLLLAPPCEQPRCEVVTKFGARVGFAMYHDGGEALSEVAARYNERSDLVPFFSLLGVSCEQRFTADRLGGWWVVEELVMIGGAEQLVVLPLAAAVVGYSGIAGVRLSAGAVLDFETRGVLLTAGWTLPTGRHSVPVELAVIPGFGWRSTITCLWLGLDRTVGDR